MKQLLIASLLLTGCVTANTAMLDKRTMVISSHGTAFNTTSGVMKNVVQTAAKEGNARGFQYFMIIDSADASSVGSYTSPTTTNANTQIRGNCVGSYCYGNAQTNATTYGGDTTYFVKPGMDVTVRFLTPDEAERANGHVWNIAEILAEK